MFGPLGVPEMLFILALALLIFGPRRLPEIGRTLGKGMAEFRKASNDLKRTINTELALEEDELTQAPRRLGPPATTHADLQPAAPIVPQGPPPQVEPRSSSSPATAPAVTAVETAVEAAPAEPRNEPVEPH